jgi:unsaturated chondroitin disaccharide hydrolase
VSFIACTSSRKDEDPFIFWRVEDVQDAIDYCAGKATRTLDQLDGYSKSPRTIPSGEQHWHSKPIGGWTSGFWAGVLWYLYEGTNDEKFRHQAEQFTDEIAALLERPVKSHDMGFIFNCSFGNGYRLTKNEVYKKILTIAADSLTHLYNDNVGTILSWPAQVRKKVFWPHNTIIDNMMNLELLFRASENTTSDFYASVARAHADVTLKNHIRPDSTLYHVLVYDDETGECLRKCTHQGYADQSVWARGQAWGIYGYTMCYRETRYPRYLETARHLAGAYLKRLPDDYVPYWDFDDPDIPNAPKDASSAAIVASAFLELSAYQKNNEDRLFYRAEAEKMLHALSTAPFLSGGENDAFLLHSTGNKPKNREVDIPVIYADYYYIEALVRLKDILSKESKQ